MTDISKYRNVSLTHYTYNILVRLSKTLLHVAKLSISKTVEALAKPEVLEVTEQISEEVIKIRNLLNLTIDEMELSVRSHNCLQAAGIKYIYELVSKEESEMLKYKNFGRKSLTELVEKLDDMGISFGMDVDKYLKLEV